jgi:hypothetical protein
VAFINVIFILYNIIAALNLAMMIRVGYGLIHGTINVRKNTIVR